MWVINLKLGLLERMNLIYLLSTGEVGGYSSSILCGV